MAGEPGVIYNGKRYPVKAGEDVLSQLLMAKANIQYLCMGGSCGTCKVCVISGGEHLEPMAGGELYYLEPESSERLACQAICLGTGDVVITQAQERDPLR
jgi:ferredoxin